MNSFNDVVRSGLRGLGLCYFWEAGEKHGSHDPEFMLGICIVYGTAVCGSVKLMKLESLTEISFLVSLSNYVVLKNGIGCVGKWFNLKSTFCFVNFDILGLQLKAKTTLNFF